MRNGRRASRSGQDPSWEERTTQPRGSCPLEKVLERRNPFTEAGQSGRSTFAKTARKSKQRPTGLQRALQGETTEGGNLLAFGIYSLSVGVGNFVIITVAIISVAYYYRNYITKFYCYYNHCYYYYCCYFVVIIIVSIARILFIVTSYYNNYNDNYL